jgi:hypothetical protein
VGIRHAFSSAKAEGADATKVRASNWNADHTVSDWYWPTITGTPSLDQIDWSPTGWNDAQPARAVRIKAQPASVSFIGGLPGGAAGRLVIIENDSTGLIGLLNEDAGSAAANRFSALCCECLWLLPQHAATLIYDGVAQRWQLAAQTYDARTMDPRTALILPSTGTGVLSIQQNTSNTATLSTIAPVGNGNEFTCRPATQITNSTASGSSDVRSAQLNHFRGSVARRNGFFFNAPFRITAASATAGAMVAMSSSTAAITSLPSATNNTIYAGIGQAGQTTMRVGARDGSAFTEVDLGANFPVPNASALYEVAFLAAPNTSRVLYAVRRLDSRAVAGGELTANLPSQTTALGPRANVMVGGTGAATTLQFNFLFTRRLDM